MRAGDTRAAEVTRYKPQCTTADEMPMATTAEASSKWARMQSFMNDPQALAKDPALRSKIVKNQKLLFELRGNLFDYLSFFTQTHRWWTARPSDRHECGTWLPSNAENEALALSFDFEVADPAQWGSWGWNEWRATGAYSSTTTAKTGSRAAMIGATTPTATTSTLSTSFTVPPSGGALTFWYMTTCTDTSAGDTMNVRLYDETSFQETYLVPSRCITSAAWTEVNLDLAAFAGHYLRLVFSNYENGTGGATNTIIDAVSFPAMAREADAYLQTHHRLSQSHAPEGVADKWFPLAFRMMKGLSSVPTTYAQRQDYIDRGVITSLALARRGFSLLQVPEVAPGSETPEQRRAVLQRRLALLQRWYSEMMTLGVYTPYADATDRLWRDTSTFLGHIWEGSHRHARDKLTAELQTGSQTGDTYSAALRSYVDLVLRAEREMLLAAFPPANEVPPVTGAPLLLVLEDGLRSAATRMSSMARIHDLGCLFRPCSVTDLASEISQTERLFGSLPDKDQLTAALQASHLVRSDWKQVFDAINARHTDVLQSAVKYALGSTVYDPKPLYLSPENLPYPMRGIAAIVQDSKQKADNYANNGLLALSRGTLTSGLQRARQAEVANQLQQKSAELTTAIAAYNSSVQSDASYRLQEITATDKAKGLEAQIRARARAFDDALEDLVGLRANQTLADAELARSGKTFAELVKTVPEAYKIPTMELTPISLSAAHARYLGQQTVASIKDVAVLVGSEVWSATGGKGDILNFQVAGQWSPTCAIRSAGTFFGKPVNGPAGGDVKGAVAGPQGFYYSNATTDFRTKAVNKAKDHSHFTEIGLNTQACAGVKVEAKLGTPGFVKAIWGAEATATTYAAVDACATIDGGQSWRNTKSDTTSDGGEARLSADFSLGIRIPMTPGAPRRTGTPYPAYPAGSLLAVLKAKAANDNGKTLDVQVVQPASSVIFPEDATLYLVVNDLDSQEHCGPPDGTQSITVTPTWLRSASGSAGHQFGQAIAEVQTYLRAETPNRLEQGRLLPADTTSLRANAMTKLAAACNCEFNSYPAVMRAFYSEVVEAEILRLERQLEMRSIERQLAIAALEIEAIKTDIGTLEGQGRFLRQLSALSLTDLEGERLYQAITALTQLATEDVYPFIHLRYPEAITGMNANSRYLDDLRNVDWTSRVDSAGGLVSSAVTHILSNLQVAYNRAPNPTTVPVALEFPRPDYEAIMGRPASQPWRVANDRVTKEVWDTLRAIAAAPAGERPALSFTITPEDLYDQIGGPAILPCSKSVPTIEAMGLFIASGFPEDDGFNSQRFDGLPGYVDPVMFWPNQTGKERTVLINTDWLHPSVPIRAGSMIQAVNMYDPNLGYPGGTLFKSGGAGTAAAGLSPFTGFSIRLDALYAGYLNYDPFQLAEGLVVVFLLDVTGRGNIAGVTTCN